MEHTEAFVKSDGEGVPVFFLRDWMSQFSFLSAGFTSRRGGVSREPYHSLNLGLHVGDVQEHVVENRRRLAHTLELPFEAFTFAEQVHGSEVAIVTARERGRGRTDMGDALPGADGMITAESGICLAAMYADCVPLYFVDPVRKVIALAHAGWKGTAQNIAASTIHQMIEVYGCVPESILAAIGPSIGPCCYEVDEYVIGNFADGQPVTEPSVNEGRFMLNLQEMNRRLMIKAGIMSTNIEVTKLCTSCQTARFFSYRAEGGKTGRMMAWMALK